MKDEEKNEEIELEENDTNPDSVLIENIADEIDNLDDVTFVESTEDGEELPTKDIVKKLREENKKLRKEKEEYLTGWQRAKADYINLQKELSEISLNLATSSKEKVIEKILPSIDSFEMAFGNKEHWQTLDKEWRDGILSIYQQLLSGLKDSGTIIIDQNNILFDPNIHQSMSIVKTKDKEMDHKVVEVLQNGYKIDNRVIRPAKVTVYEYEN